MSSYPFYLPSFPFSLALNSFLSSMPDAPCTIVYCLLLQKGFRKRKESIQKRTNCPKNPRTSPRGITPYKSECTRSSYPRNMWPWAVNGIAVGITYYRRMGNSSAVHFYNDLSIKYACFDLMDCILVFGSFCLCVIIFF